MPIASDYRYAYEKHPDTGVIYRQLLHDLDAREAAQRFPDRWSLIPPLDGKFLDKPTPQSAATDKPVAPPEQTDEEKREAWRKQLREEWERDRLAADERGEATAAARATRKEGEDPDRPVLGPPSVDRPIDQPDGRGEFPDRSGPAVKMAERGEDPGIPAFADPKETQDAKPAKPLERPDNSKTPPDVSGPSLDADLGKGTKKK